MSYLCKNNIVNSDSVTGITHTISSGTGTITAITDINRIADRSVLNRYEYSFTGLSNESTIEITLDKDYNDISSICVLGGYWLYTYNYNFRVALLNSGGTTLYATGVPDKTRQRAINYGDYPHWLYDIFYTFAAVNGVRKIRIIFDNAREVLPVTINQFLGTIHVGEALDVKVKPLSLKYTFGTQGSKERTRGGQVIADRNNSYLISSFTTTAEVETDLINKYFDTMYECSLSEPVVFIPSTTGVIQYGTLSRPTSSSLIEGKQNGEWFFETSFNIEEEF